MATHTSTFRKEVKAASVIQWNARGLKSRLSDFRQFVFTNVFPIIVICEHNLSKPIRLSGYEAVMSSTNGACSKIIVFVRRELTYVVQPIAPHDDNQYVCITVKKNQLMFTLIGVYISPSSNLDSRRLADILRVCPAPWVLIGDFNAHNHAWGSTRTNARGRRLANIAYNYGLTLLNDGSPTFLRGVTYGSCLDLAFVSNSLSRYVKWFPDVETRGSDHIPVYLNIKGLSRCGPRMSIRAVQWTNFKSDMADACSDGL